MPSPFVPGIFPSTEPPGLGLTDLLTPPLYNRDMFGHYEFMLNANGKEIDYAQSFFCGDAAGRHAKKGKPKDYGTFRPHILRGTNASAALTDHICFPSSALSELGSRVCRQRRSTLRSPRGASTFFKLSFPFSPLAGRASSAYVPQH